MERPHQHHSQSELVLALLIVVMLTSPILAADSTDASLVPTAEQYPDGLPVP